MVRRLVRIIFIVPLLLLVWAYANSIGVTHSVNQATGANIPTNFSIPYIDKEWSQGKKDAPHPAIIAKEMARQLGEEGAPEAALNAVAGMFKVAGLTVSDLLGAYQEGVAASQKQVDSGQFGPAFPDLPDLPSLPGAPTAPSAPAPTLPATKNKYQVALDDANALVVKGRAAKTGYTRAKFGKAWTDDVDVALGRNGCDTRNDILARDLISVVYSDSKNCKVATGVLVYEPYTGASNVQFVAGGDYANQLDNEHIVALGDAWQKGAQQWSTAKRAQFANDPINLMMVDPSSNRAKGDKDAATWLPPNKSFRCDYIVMQVNVKTAYGVWVTKAEQSAMVDILEKC